MSKARIPEEPRFFRTAADLRKWLEKNHSTAKELWVGLYKVSTGKPSITWPEVVDQVLCFGWIDGIRRGIDEESYMNRITPRKPGSNWSAVNIAKVEELKKKGLMTPAGLEAFERRRESRSRVYSYERADAGRLEPRYERRLRTDRKAWEFFSSQAPSYRKAAAHWIMSAKREETREKRLAELMEHSARGERPRPFRPR